MKIVGSILLGSLLTIGVQIFMQSDYSIINKAEAAQENCMVANGSTLMYFSESINSAYQRGYRVAGSGMARSSNGFQYSAVMCK